MGIYDERAPFGNTVLFGKKAAGKTLTAINSPWQPVHVIDLEDSAGAYFIEQEKLIKLKFIRAPFTRSACATYPEFQQEVRRIMGFGADGLQKINDGLRFGTIVVDTAGQYSEWVKSQEFSMPKADSMSQIVWGRIRDTLRRHSIGLAGHCNLLIFTAHEREYKGVISPRINPALLEICGLNIRLVRGPNDKIPDGQVVASRLPYFPPSIPKFFFDKMMPYIDKPVDWDKLTDEEKIKEQLPSGENSEDDEE